ncbi:unnamed protein product [Prunus armeniaca]
MAHSCKVGEDLLVKILSSLPPKSLMRFKCAAKWWYALINNPRFVDNQLSNCLHNNRSIFLKRLVPNKDSNASETESVFSVLTFCEDADGGAHRFLLSRVEDINVPVSMSVMSGGEELRIVGHCHGIICVHVDNYSKVFVWNPAIQEFKLLPSEKYFTDWESLDQQRAPYLPLNNRLEWAMGFGYDPISKAYKVVSIIFYGSQRHAHTLYSVVIYPLRVQVYTLGSSEESSSWREIKTCSLETETTFLWPQIFQIHLKGMCYWLGSEQQKEFVHEEELRYEEMIRQVVVSFDMSDEVFDEVTLPDELLDHERTFLGLFMLLTVWNESSIALCVWHNSCDVSPYFGMWLLDNDFGACVWTKHAGFELTSIPIMDLREGGGHVLALWKSDELLVVDEDGCTICYNLRTENRMSLPTIQICMSNMDSPIVYVNSIVSIGLGRHQT